MKYIDLTSDTVAKSLPIMKQAFIIADYGDYSVSKYDPPFQQLQKQTAQMMGKQAASFVPSRTFANQCLALTAMRPGQQILVGQNSHMMQQQAGGLGMISRIMTKQIQCKEGCLMKIQGLKKSIRKVIDNVAPITKVFSIQNPTPQGRVYPLQQFYQFIKIAKNNKLLVHLDGARVLNAAIYYNLDIKQLVKDIDFVTISLTKGLCVPFGALVTGSKQFIKRYNINRRMLGGIFRKMGMYAAMALVSYKIIKPQIYKNHQMAILLGQKLDKFDWICIDKNIDTNMIFFCITNQKVNVQQLENYLLDQGIKVDFRKFYNGKIRLMTHYYIRNKQIQNFIQKIEKYQKKFIQKDKT